MLTATLDLMNVTAGLIEEQFGKYFSAVMPLLKDILTTYQPTSPESMRLRAKTIECMGILTAAISDSYTAGEVPSTQEG